MHEVARAEPLAHRRLPVAVVAAGGDPVVELLELVGHARPFEVGVRGRDPVRVALHELRVAEQPLELRGERERVARLEQQPELAVAQQLLVLGQPRHHRHRAARHRRAARAAAPARCPPTPPPRSSRARGAGPPSRRPARPACTRSRSRREQRGRRAGRRVAQPDRGAPVEVASAGAAARGGRAAARRAPPRPRTRSRAGPPASAGALVEVGAGTDQPVVAGEVALHQVAGGGEARGAAVEAAEQELHDPARHLGRDEAAPWSSGSVPMFSAREWRSAADAALGANGSCTWRKSSSACSSSVLERARHVERQRHRAAAPERQPLAHRHAPTRSPRSAKSASGSSWSASTFARPSRTSSRESDGATTTTRWPRAHSSSESRSTKRLTSWCCSQGQGVTWAIA